MLCKQENLYAFEVSRQDREEPGTLISLHVLDAVSKRDVVFYITVYSPDTDVFILLLHLFARNSITGELIFKTGKGKLQSKISINECYKYIGTNKAMRLMGLCMLSGANWGVKFF